MLDVGCAEYGNFSGRMARRSRDFTWAAKRSLRRTQKSRRSYTPAKESTRRRLPQFRASARQLPRRDSRGSPLRRRTRCRPAAESSRPRIGTPLPQSPCGNLPRQLRGAATASEAMRDARIGTSRRSLHVKPSLPIRQSTSSALLAASPGFSRRGVGREGGRVVERLRDWVSRGVEAGQEFDPPFRLLQQVVAVAQQLHALFVLFQRLAQPRLAFLQRMDDLFELFEGLLEAGAGRCVFFRCWKT